MDVGSIATHISHVNKFEYLETSSGSISSATLRKYKDAIANELLLLTSNCTQDKFEIIERLYWVKHDLIHRPFCKTCNNELSANRFINYKHGYYEYCSQLCSKRDIENVEKRKQKSIAKYGAEHHTQTQQYRDNFKNNCLEKYEVEHFSKLTKTQDKKKNTCLEKYGVANTFQLVDKIKATNLERYGVEHPLHNREQAKQTCLERYGVEHHSSAEEVKQKKLNTLITRYGADNLSRIPEFKDRMVKSRIMRWLPLRISAMADKVIPNFDLSIYTGKNQQLDWKCVKCDTQFQDDLDDGKIPRCPTCYPKSSYTKSQLEIYNAIRELYDGEIVLNTRTIIAPREIDIYFPDDKFGIEINGIYWHSEKAGGYKEYHLEKLESCEKNGIKLYHIFEDEWINNSVIVLSRIKHALKINDDVIYARRCSIKEISANVANEFLMMHHLQGSDKSKIRYGLYDATKLIAVMTFGKNRFYKNNDWELLRYCTTGSSVVGGASKLFKHFIKNNLPQRVITYADRRWGNGNFYEKLGFSFSHNTELDYFYLVNNTRKNRINYQKHKLAAILPIYDASLTEVQNMELNKYYRIWGCGHKCYVWNFNS